MPDCPGCGSTVDESVTYCPDCGVHVEGRAEEPPDRPRQPREQTGTGSDAVWGFLAGGLAVVAGFVATLVLSDSTENLELAEDLVSSAGPSGAAASSFLPEPYQLIAWEYLENHQVPISVEITDQIGNPDWASDYIELLVPASSKLQVFPPLLLLVAGFAVAIRGQGNEVRDAVQAGALVVLGYLPGIAAIVYVASFEVSVPFLSVSLVEIGPDIVIAVALAGILYPLAFGALGGALAFFVVRRF